MPLSKHRLHDLRGAHEEQRPAATKGLPLHRGTGDQVALRAWLDVVVAYPEMPLSDAVRWLDNGWTQLSRFLDDPKIPLDNGLAERVMRGVVLGRKTYAGSRSKKGTMVAALFNSLIQSCRLVGVDPHAYMIEAAERAAKDRSDVLLTEDYAALLKERSG